MIRRPCPRTLLAQSPLATVEVSECGIREVHVNGMTFSFEAQAFEEFIGTLQQASAVLMNSGRVVPRILSLVESDDDALEPGSQPGSQNHSFPSSCS